MDGAVPKRFRDLGEIHSAFPDELFGSVDFQQGEIVDDSAAGMVRKQFLQKRTSHQIVAADPVDGQVFGDVILHVCNDVAE